MIYHVEYKRVKETMNLNLTEQLIPQYDNTFFFVQLLRQDNFAHEGIPSQMICLPIRPLLPPHSYLASLFPPESNPLCRRRESHLQTLGGDGEGGELSRGGQAGHERKVRC